MSATRAGRLTSSTSPPVEPQPARPVGRRHRTLAHRLHVAEPQRAGAGADDDGVLAGHDLARRQLSRRPGVSGPSLSRSPAYVVQAPGAGVQARTCRSIAAAGCDQSTRASSTVIFGRERHVVGRLGPLLERAVGEAVEGGDQEPGAALGEAGEQVAGGVVAAGSSRSSRRTSGRRRAPGRSGTWSRR